MARRGRPVPADLSVKRGIAKILLDVCRGHCILTGYMGLRPQDPDTLACDKINMKLRRDDVRDFAGA